MQQRNRTDNQGHCCKQLADVLGHHTFRATLVHISPEDWSTGQQGTNRYPGATGPGYYLAVDLAGDEPVVAPSIVQAKPGVQYQPLYTCPFCKADLALRHFRLPRNWEHAFGYNGDAGQVSFYWTPFGDEAMYDDGHISGDGNWQLFLDLYHTLNMGRRYNLGSSDEEADDWLLLDRAARTLAALPRDEAQARLREQWSPLDVDAELVSLDWGTIQEALDYALAQTDAAAKVIRPCDTCFYSISPGWLRAEDGGFDRCPVCNGYGFLPTPPDLVIGEEP